METMKEFKERIKNNHKVVNLLKKLRPESSMKEIYLFAFNFDSYLKDMWNEIANKQNNNNVGGIK